MTFSRKNFSRELAAIYYGYKRILFKKTTGRGPGLRMGDTHREIPEAVPDEQKRDQRRAGPVRHQTTAASSNAIRTQKGNVAESHLTRRLFGSMVRRIAPCRWL